MSTTSLGTAEAFDLLRQESISRLLHDQPLAWSDGETVFNAEPRPDKYPDAWLVRANRWEKYYPRAHVLEQLKSATMLPAYGDD